MIQEPFADGKSLLHTVDPRYRLVAAVIFSFLVALSYQMQTLIYALAGAIILAILAKLNFFQVVKRLATLIGFLLLLWVVLPISYEGPILTHIGPVEIFREGVMLALQITAKSIAILTAFMALIATMPISTLGHTMGRLGIPTKIIHLLLITYRYIFVIEQEYQRLITAIKIRGFTPGTNLHSYRTYAYLVGMLFVRASVRAQRVNQAMRCRGFNGKFYSLYHFAPSPLNLFFGTGFTALIILLLSVEWGGRAMFI